MSCETICYLIKYAREQKELIDRLNELYPKLNDKNLSEDERDEIEMAIEYNLEELEKVTRNLIEGLIDVLWEG